MPTKSVHVYKIWKYTIPTLCCIEDRKKGKNKNNKRFPR